MSVYVRHWLEITLMSPLQSTLLILCMQTQHMGAILLMLQILASQSELFQVFSYVALRTHTLIDNHVVSVRGCGPLDSFVLCNHSIDD